MIKKIMIPLYMDEVAPRFDLAVESMIITISGESVVEEERSVVLAQASAEKLCQLILMENISVLICGAIEEEYYQFLKWKKVEVFDSVVGPASSVFEEWQKKRLASGDIYVDRMIEGRRVK